MNLCTVLASFMCRKKAIAKDNKDNKHVHCHYPKKPSR